MAYSRVAKEEDGLHAICRIAMAATVFDKLSDKPWYTLSGLGGRSVAETPSTQQELLT
jgi:hypothetical protein